MGSSFAAGPGVTVSADQPGNRCGRSADNYARLLARKRMLKLVDVSCGGASTAHLLGPWNELPPQVEALTADTRLVTVTIGGNDIGYISGLGAASCRLVGVPAGAPFTRCPDVPRANEQAWQELEERMRRVATEVRRRAPAARLVFVDYQTVLPDQGTCSETPLPPEQAEASRAVARRLEALTARVAAEIGADVLRASALSKGHDACSEHPWMNGFPQPGKTFVGAPYHPNAAGMTAIAEALDRLLFR